ncbi:uncharacterized protein [Porites lutea]|uniref:uncharacterized protein isoform X7 n=1 Tax=Porites lutea TaxID=51062 RepID=UPI003CC69147
MVEKCVVFGCSNSRNVERGISMHKIPSDNDPRPEVLRRRQRWIKFVNETRKHWTPGKTSSICSVHFKPEDFTRPFQSNLKRLLKEDEFGVCVWPTIHVGKRGSENDHQGSPTKRQKRMNVRSAKERMSNLDSSCAAIELEPSTGHQDTTLDVSCTEPETSTSQDTTLVLNVSCTESETSTNQDTTLDLNVGCTEPGTSTSQDTTLDLNVSCTEPGTSTSQDTTPDLNVQHKSVQTLTDSTQSKLLRETEVLQGKLATTRQALQRQTAKNKYLKKKVQQLSKKLNETEESERKLSAEEQEEEEEEEGDLEEEEDQYADEETDTETIEEEPDFTSGSNYEPASESEEDGDAGDSDIDEVFKSTRVKSPKDGNLRTEPKFIVFLSQLMLLFQSCHVCKGKNPPEVEAQQIGTKAVITTVCTNPGCCAESTWHSQPNMPGTKLPAGNFLLCMSVLFAGGSITKIRQIFNHMGLACVSVNTFFKHQRSHLFPTVHLFWKDYQTRLLAKLKDLGTGLVLAGDGRHDSMGHCAKFGAYTILCCTAIPSIIHFALVQRNQAGNSPAMEFMGFQLCMNFLAGCGIVITTFISDRHTQIAAYFKTVLKHITQYFDLWHLKKKIKKLISKLAKEKDNEQLKEWIKPCTNHLHWSATTTPSGNGKIIWAKFKSFLSHIVNKHSDLDDPLFNKCAHGEINDRTWLQTDDKAYERLCKVLTTNSLKKGIQQASPIDQTDCLEGFHSVLNQFAPKMIAYSYVGMLCRHILAALHFNYNLRREAKTNPDGTEKVKVSYPKYKNGEATVRSVKIEQNFDYVEELYQFYLKSSKEDLASAVDELKEMTPQPMLSMFEKQPKEAAIQKWSERRRMVTKEVPPTVEAPVEQPEGRTGTQTTARKERRCRTCKEPLKGHKNVTHCPKNQK